MFTEPSEFISQSVGEGAQYGEKVYPGCTSIHCIGEGRPIVLEGIRGSWLKSIFDDQLRLPAVETTIAWKCPKKPFR